GWPGGGGRRGGRPGGGPRGGWRRSAAPPLAVRRDGGVRGDAIVLPGRHAKYRPEIEEGRRHRLSRCRAMGVSGGTRACCRAVTRSAPLRLKKVGGTASRGAARWGFQGGRERVAGPS